MHDARTRPCRPRWLHVDVAATRAECALWTHVDVHAPNVWYQLPNVVVPTCVRRVVQARAAFALSVPLIELAIAAGIVRPATSSVNSVSLKRIAVASPQGSLPPKFFP